MKTTTAARSPRPSRSTPSTRRWSPLKEESKNGNDVVVSLTADDGAAGSGVTRVLYSTGPSSNPKSNENTMWGHLHRRGQGEGAALPLTTTLYVHFYAQDAAGNESDYANINLGKGEA